MEKKNFFDMKVRQSAFLRYASITAAFNDYEYNPDSDMAKKLVLAWCTVKTGFVLPSGRWGTALAVALENHQFNVALYIVEHKDELNIDLQMISSSFGYSDVAGFNDVLQFVLSYYETKERELAVSHLTEQFPEKGKKENERFSRELEAIRMLCEYSEKGFGGKSPF